MIRETEVEELRQNVQWWAKRAREFEERAEQAEVIDDERTWLRTELDGVCERAENAERERDKLDDELSQIKHHPTISEQIHDALAHADVNVCEILPPVVAYPCTWCQNIGAICSLTVYWTPRVDVMSDGYAECCRDCAPERIRRAVDDSLPAARVTVEIVGGEQ